MISQLIQNCKKFNKVILLLTFSDVFVWGSYTIISVLAGIYLSEKFGVETIKFLGIGTSIYLFTRSIFQIPIGLINDKYKNDKDEIILLIIGIFLMGTPFLFYPVISQPYQYFLLQFIFGIWVIYILI
jgi:MFS family permease